MNDGLAFDIYLVDWWYGQNTSQFMLMKHLRSSDTPKNVRI